MKRFVSRAVCLTAKQPLRPGDALTLDYGHRPMRDMLRGYGFVPENSAYEAWTRSISMCECCCRAVHTHAHDPGHVIVVTHRAVAHLLQPDLAAPVGALSVLGPACPLNMNARYNAGRHYQFALPDA